MHSLADAWRRTAYLLNLLVVGRLSLPEALRCAAGELETWVLRRRRHVHGPFPMLRCSVGSGS